MPVGEEVVGQDDDALGAGGHVPVRLQGGVERGNVQRVGCIRHAQGRGEGDAARCGDTDVRHAVNLGQAPTAVTASGWGALGLRWQREAFTSGDPPHTDCSIIIPTGGRRHSARRGAVYSCCSIQSGRETRLDDTAATPTWRVLPPGPMETE